MLNREVKNINWHFENAVNSTIMEQTVHLPRTAWKHGELNFRIDHCVSFNAIQVRSRSAKMNGWSAEGQTNRQRFGTITCYNNFEPVKDGSRAQLADKSLIKKDLFWNYRWYAETNKS